MKIAVYCPGVFSIMRIRRDILWMIILFFCLGFWGASSQAEKPFIPLQVSLHLVDGPGSGGEATFQVEVKSFIDVPQARIRCHLPKSLQVVSGEEVWEGALVAGQAKKLMMRVRMREPGPHPIRATAIMEFAGGAKVQQHGVLVLDRDGEVKPKAKKRGKGPTVRKGEDGKFIFEPRQD